MKKLWMQKKHENMTYFTLASSRYTPEFFHKDDLNPTKLVQIVKDKGYNNDNWGDYLEIMFSKKDKWPDDATDLPAGAYRLKPSEDLPMRLEVSDVRDENYIPIESDSTLVKDMERFLQSRDIFEKLKFSYRRGYLLYGEPGTGKTAFIRHLTKQPAFSDALIIWLNFIPPQSIIKALNADPRLKVIVLEELVEQNGALSYNMKHLLEFLDGEATINNCITIATTNYPQFLHKNLADRPSRFDVLYEMKRQPVAVIKTVLESWLGREVNKDEFDFSEFTLASLKEICLLHKFHDITLNEAAKKLKKQSRKFEKNFEEKNERAFGLGGDDD